MKEKKLEHIGAPNIRELLTKANSLHIHKEDFIQIIKTESALFLVYESQ